MKHSEKLTYCIKGHMNVKIDDANKYNAPDLI